MTKTEKRRWIPVIKARVLKKMGKFVFGVYVEGVMNCPVCNRKLRLFYLRSLGGNLFVKCRTKGCISFMDLVKIK